MEKRPPPDDALTEDLFEYKFVTLPAQKEDEAHDFWKETGRPSHRFETVYGPSYFPAQKTSFFPFYHFRQAVGLPPISYKEERMQPPKLYYGAASRRSRSLFSVPKSVGRAYLNGNTGFYTSFVKLSQTTANV